MKILSEYRLPFAYDTDYAYGVGRIRALETRLLTRQDMARLLAAADVASFFQALAETDYGQTLDPETDPDRFEESLNAHLSSVLNLVLRLSKDPEVTSVLKSRYDYHNVRVLLKAKLSGRELEYALSDLGQVQPIELAKALEQEDSADIPEHLRRAIAAVERFDSGEIDPQMLDVVVDGEMFSHLLSVLSVSGVPFLWGWLEREIDLANIRTFLRLQASQGAPDVLKRSLYRGGSLAVTFYQALEEQSLEGLPQRFAQTRYARLIDEGILSLRTKGSFARLEQLCDGFVMTYLRRAAVATFGIEPLMAYALMKEFEIKAVRTVFVGMWNRISVDSIRERLPDAYL